MRHGKKIAYLGRTSSHRRAMLRNMAISLIEHKAIKTTLPKAKALRVFIEPLITKAKTDNMHSRRVIFSYLNNKEAVKELFGEIAEKVADRPGGYTRILKLGSRRGDNAEVALIELVDFNEFDYTQNKSAGSSRRRRRRRGGNKKTSEQENKAVAQETKEESKENLTKIEGIGPKVQEVLYAAGITTFEQLATSDAGKIKEILDEAGGAMKSMDPTTWPQQAVLAAAGDWDELSSLQDELKGGKVVEEDPTDESPAEDAPEENNEEEDKE